MTFWMYEYDPADVRTYGDFQHPQILFGSRPKVPKLRMRPLTALARDKRGQAVKMNHEVAADASSVARTIAETAPEQRGELYDASANMLRVTENAFTSELFSALAREERQHDAAPVLGQREARALR